MHQPQKTHQYKTILCYTWESSRIKSMVHLLSSQPPASKLLFVLPGVN